MCLLAHKALPIPLIFSSSQTIHACQCARRNRRSQPSTGPGCRSRTRSCTRSGPAWRGRERRQRARWQAWAARCRGRRPKPWRRRRQGTFRKWTLMAPGKVCVFNGHTTSGWSPGWQEHVASSRGPSQPVPGSPQLGHLGIVVSGY
jgi:hypothetical protein